MEKSKWFPFNEQRNEKKPYLFCFHHAGGSAATFRNWMKWSHLIEVVPVELPGKGMRQKEDFIEEASLLSKIIAEEISVITEEQSIFLYGHSMGAALAFFTGIELTKNKPVKQLIVSGRQAPHLPNSDFYHSSMGEEDLLSELKRLKGTPREVLENQSLLNYLLPIIRNDYILSESFFYQSEVADFPIIAYYGDQDDVQEEIKKWSEVTEKNFHVLKQPGNHFFPFTLGSDFWQEVESKIEKIIGGIER